MSWEGETEFEPPHELRHTELRLDDDRNVDGLRSAMPRLVRPDAVLEIERRDGDGTTMFLIEYDRTRRVDKNFEKFLRYDNFLCWWWRRTGLAVQPSTPFVVFVCQEAEQQRAFLDVADRELTGHLWHPGSDTGSEYPGRDHILFAVQGDAHAGRVAAARVSAAPRGVREAGDLRGNRAVRLPGGARGPV